MPRIFLLSVSFLAAPMILRGQCAALYATGLSPTVTGAGPLAPFYPVVANNCASEPGIPYMESNYNIVLKNPNWVAYRLTPARMAMINAHNSTWRLAHIDCCQMDPRFSSMVQGMSIAFNGLHEGHLAPQRSMRQALVALQFANLYTNISPMFSTLNLGPWHALENQIRAWASSGVAAQSDITVVAGPLFNNAAAPTITPGSPAQLQVALPNSFFMALYFNGAAAGARQQFYIFPNTLGPYNPWNTYQLANLAAFNGALPANYNLNLNFGPP
jgi:DNA/RNA endonuclease G (NUC1)